MLTQNKEHLHYSYCTRKLDIIYPGTCVTDLFINFQISVYFFRKQYFFYFPANVLLKTLFIRSSKTYISSFPGNERVKLALSLTPRLTGQRVKNNQKYCDTTFGRRDVIYGMPSY